jgi:indole-3-glycerol phosphate synthase
MTLLRDILKVKTEEIKKLKQKYSASSFRDQEYFELQGLSLKSAIAKNQRLALIAEVKKASPSKGIISPGFNHMKTAEAYMQGGADAISVLTDRNFFQGDISFLREIAKIKNVPLLRKDFVIDVIQVFEAKASGADALLLIAEALSINQIGELTAAAEDCGLEVLLELHSESQLSKIDFSKNKLIGINNRDLTTFDVDLCTTLRLAEKVPDGTLLISESGISSADDIKRLHAAGVKGLLVGEHFMRSDSIKNKVCEFIEWCSNES